MDAKKEELVSVRNNHRWAKAIYACLDKVEDLMKASDVTKESAEIAQILADIARRLESTG